MVHIKYHDEAHRAQAAYMRERRLRRSPDQVKEDRKRASALLAQRRRRVIAHYGDKCWCCGETEYGFLTIDHVVGGGWRDRREQGGSFWGNVIKKGFPSDLRVLCWNCNSGREMNSKNPGICPHAERGIPDIHFLVA